MAETLTKTDDTQTDDKTQKQYEEIPALQIEKGVGSALAYSAPFNAAQYGLNQSEKDLLREVMRDDEYDVQRPSLRQIVTMRRMDGHARALYRLLTMPIRAALKTATFVPAEGGEEEAEFMEQVFRTPPASGGMTSTFQSFMGQLLSGVFDGFSAFEKVFWMPEFGPLAGKYTLQKLAHRPADTVTFLSDRSGGFAGIRQRSHRGGETVDIVIEPEYAFYYAAQEEERKFYGVSFFESAYPHYDAKVKAYFTAHLAAQRAAVGTRVGSVPPNASKAAKGEFATSLSNLALAQWMMVPDGFKVEVLREGGSYDFLSLINHHNHMMSESVLANFFDKDTGGGSGESGALVNFAQPGDEMFILMIRAIMDDIADSINHYIVPQLIDYNYDGQKYPVFTWGTLTDEQRSAIASTFDKLATAGQSANVSHQFIRELEKTQAKEMGLEIDWEAVEAEEAAQAQQAMAMGGDPNNPMGGPGGDPGGDPGMGGPGMGAPGDPSLSAVAAQGTSITDADLEEVESLADVLKIMAKRADAAMAAGQQPQPMGGADPTQPNPDEEEPPVKLSGITDEMYDWAAKMVVHAGEDWSDG